MKRLTTDEKIDRVRQIHEGLNDLAHSDAKDILNAVLATMGADYLERAGELAHAEHTESLRKTKERYGL